MAFTRTLRSAGGVVLAGALVFAAAPAASADQTREDQWPLEAFDAASIWKISKGKGVTVAVIDSGVNAGHVDLKGNVVEGKDFIDGGSTAPEAGDDHGTAMASIIAAHGHGPGGADGVMGLAPDAKILDIRDDGHHDDGFAESIRYAVDHGASVINVSSGGAVKVDAEAEAVAYALKKNVVVVAASGNEGSEVRYPAGHPGAIAVGAVKNNTEIWEGSNHGPQLLLSGPGTFIVSAGGKDNAAYRSGTGTSDASAFVAAAAALLRAKFPDLTAGQIVNRLTKSAGLPSSEKGASLPDEHYGYGFIQPLAALTRDISAGPTYGPLKVPESLQAGQSDDGQGTTDDPSASAPDATAGGMSDDEQAAADRKQVIALGVIGVVGLLVLALVVFLIVKLARRNKGNRGGPGGPGGPSGWGGDGQPQYGRTPHQPQYQQGGNPYQQQSQAPGRWPNQ
ncbi:S8 family serine peptidase [Actinacidiphila glaucinigra]|uniref:Type VII secretion-associated serine protease mycosin n=1 Tax=Actinacidiphila glaucinigra TaxID=235986 RepID=A0A239NJ05_9ACTN|nr:S8 family serine peptidase [Actinacidiphila glaucinigra]SNT54855.1 type VII secretion-associated serine protease mycosin [Actinacidiphila glaucinigra]